jgi:hypothetical protein
MTSWLKLGCRVGIVAWPVAIFLTTFDTGPVIAQLQPNPAMQAFQIKQAPSSQPSYSQQYESHIIFQRDRSETQVFTNRFKILMPSAIQTTSRQKLLFVEGAQILDTLEAYTEKPDGKRLIVDPKNILTQDLPPGQPLSNVRNVKQRTIIFPDVAVGDTLVMTHKKAPAKQVTYGQATEHYEFPRSSGFTSVKITVEAPTSIGLRVGTAGNGVAESVSESGGTRRHTIIITPESYAAEEAGAVSPLDRDPVVLLSTLSSYEEFGSIYGKLALPKASVTRSISALANEITSGISDRRLQAVAIDAWMKKNIQYVDVVLSKDRFIPNDAATVLKNKSGDCKDKVTLMAALLAAKGIASETTLINLGNSYTLPNPPTFVQLNHAILYLPEFGLYDDPTANQAAFGVLAIQAYDKPVVRISARVARLDRTPAMKPNDHTASIRTTINFAADGSETGRTVESDTGTFGIELRAAGAVMQKLGDAAARQELRKSYMSGTGHFDLGDLAETMDPVVIKSSFALDTKFRPPPEGARGIVPRGIVLTMRPEKLFFGSRVNGRKASFVCFAGRQTEDIEATFDPALPMPIPLDPVTIDRPAFSYRSSTEIDGRTLKVHREFISRVQRQVCAPELEAQIAEDLDAVSTEAYRTYAFEHAVGVMTGAAPNKAE